jgi:transcription elongation GreA/GreB family factor
VEAIKSELFKKYKILLQDKIDIYQDLIDSLTNDAQNDAKSSAGDKHETTLSKLHIEQEKIGQKLKEALAQYQILTKIEAHQKNNTSAVLGSLVVTNHLKVLIATALPKIVVNDEAYFAISPKSPLGECLLGQVKGYAFQLNQVSYQIEAIF